MRYKFSGDFELVIHPLWLCGLFLACVSSFWVEWLLVQFIVLLHECGHFVAMYCFRWKINQLECSPLGFLLNAQPAQFPATQERLIVALSGPFVNLLILFLGLSLGADNHNLNSLMQTNWTIAWFNLLPILPLDGGKVIQAIAYRWFSFWQVEKWLLYLGMGLAFSGIIWSAGFIHGVFDFNLLLLFVYIMFENWQRRKMLVFHWIQMLRHKSELLHSAGDLVPSGSFLQHTSHFKCLRQSRAHPAHWFSATKQQETEQALLSRIFYR